MKTLLYHHRGLPQKAIDLAYSLRPEGVELEYLGERAGDEKELARAIAESDVLMGIIIKPLPPMAMKAAAGLKLIQLITAGYDEVDIAAMRRLRVPVSTNGGANAGAVAEHTILLMLALYRNLVNTSMRVKYGAWRKSTGVLDEVYELEGKTVGLVGLGMIGREVAKRLRAFGTRAVYYSRSRKGAEEEESLGVEYVPFEELLCTSDIVSLHTPLSEETRHMIGKAELAKMKRSAVLINTCRGGVVDGTALYEALRDGVIAAAGLDAYEPEPPLPDSPLLQLPNVIATPHLGGPTAESWTKRILNSYENIRRVSEGRDPLWVVPELRSLLGGGGR